MLAIGLLFPVMLSLNDIYFWNRIVGYVFIVHKFKYPEKYSLELVPVSPTFDSSSLHDEISP